MPGQCPANCPGPGSPTLITHHGPFRKRGYVFAGMAIAVRADAIEQTRSSSFWPELSSRRPANALHHSALHTPSNGGVPASVPNRFQDCYRGGGTHHDRRNGRMIALTTITEVLLQPTAMSDRQAIVLILLVSLGLWVAIWGLILAIVDMLDFFS